MKTGTAPLPVLQSVKVLDQLPERIRYLHYSIRTEEAYVYWVHTFSQFNGFRHPAAMVGAEVEVFLSRIVSYRHCRAGNFARSEISDNRILTA